MYDQPLLVVQSNFVTKLTEPAALAGRKLGIFVHDVSSGDPVYGRPLPLGGRWSPILIFGSIIFVEQWMSTKDDLRR